jgi:hypothetical protein
MLRDRTGNRARILHYLLGLADIPSKLVVARPLSADQTESGLADGETFQHLLVMIGDGDDATLLSTVDRGAPFGYVPAALRGQPALVLVEGAPRITIPAAPEGSDRRTIEADVEVARDGSAKIEVVETFRGATAVAWRTDLESVPNAVLEERFEEAYVSRLVPGAALESLRITGREDPEQPLVFHYRFEVSELGRRQNGRRVVPGFFPSQLAPVYAPLGERTTPEIVAPAIDADVTVRFRVGDGMELPRAPRPVEQRAPGGARFVMRARREGDALVMERSVRLPIMRVSPSAYPALARFCRGVDEVEAREITVPLR